LKLRNLPLTDRVKIGMCFLDSGDSFTVSDCIV